MKVRRPRLALILMGLSLILLALFEIFWLDKEYQDQKDWLHHEQSEFFVSSIRSIEDSLFHAMVLTPLRVKVDSNIEFRSPRGSRVLFSGDSTKYMTIVRSINVDQRDKKDNEVKEEKTEQEKKRYSHHRSMMLGALSLHLAEEKDSLVVVAELTNMIENELDERKANAPPLAYQLTTWKHEDGEDAPQHGLVSRPYYDAVSRQHIALFYPQYQAFLLKRILPQILFAIFLFTCISTAFYLIYRSLRKQQKLAAMKNDFISNITHELKTPISTVRVALEALQNFSADRDPAKSKEYLEISQNELDRLALLVDKVLKMSNFEGSQALKIERFDMKELIQQILSTMKVQFNRFSADVQFNVNGGDFEIEADRLHMTGVVYNLLDNALKYSPSDPSINISLDQQNGNVVLAVEDHGQGISREYAGKVFDKFFRVPSGNQHNIKGHGLGLSYVAEVVAQHRGTIRVDSEIGKGSTFTLTLPRAHAN
ncbi:MAG: HAMP domain-containing sensor histidine kinase [Saprospiraceae bacterium]|nr:HAMP domain-containing sensor histidine kinase [Saprospiraceae bacterium]